MKTIARFLPLADRPAEDCDRHYREVHLPLARRLLGGVRGIEHYGAWRVTHQRDAAGGFHRRPSAWRFAVQRFTGAAGSSAFPVAVRTRLAEDHRNCLARLRRCEVDETVLLDRMTGQVACCSYLVEIDAREGQEVEVSRARARAFAVLLAGEASQAEGLRRVTLDLVRRETRAEPLDEPGQLLTADFLGATDKAAYIEVVADDRCYGDALLRRPEIDEALTELEMEDAAACFVVQETCGFDRR